MKRHRGGDAPSHVPSSRRRIPPRRFEGDAEARAMPAPASRDAGPAGRLVVRLRWHFASVSRHPRPNARRWRGNERDAIALLSFVLSREDAEKGGTRAYVARLVDALRANAVASTDARAGHYVSKMKRLSERAPSVGGKLSSHFFYRRDRDENSTVHETETSVSSFFLVEKLANRKRFFFIDARRFFYRSLRVPVTLPSRLRARARLYSLPSTAMVALESIRPRALQPSSEPASSASRNEPRGDAAASRRAATPGFPLESLPRADAAPAPALGASAAALRDDRSRSSASGRSVSAFLISPARAIKRETSPGAKLSRRSGAARRRALRLPGRFRLSVLSRLSGSPVAARREASRFAARIEPRALSFSSPEPPEPLETGRPRITALARSASRAAREAARKAAEGERRRRLSILQFEEEEQRRVRRSHQRLAIEAMEAERERRLLLLAREDAEVLEERHALQQQVRKAVAQERSRRVVVLRSVEVEAIGLGLRLGSGSGSGPGLGLKIAPSP